MTLLQDVRSVTSGLSTPEMLRYLIAERFAGRTAVTASLKAASVTVLKMVADADPETPVIFCHPGYVFPESIEYRERIVALLGLSDVRVTTGHEMQVAPGDTDHYEKMWAEIPDGSGRVQEIVHINEALAPYDCWISAVYHAPAPAGKRNRVDIERRLIRVDPLVRWSREEIAAFMRDNGLPFHPRSVRRPPRPHAPEEPLPPTYHY